MCLGGLDEMGEWIPEAFCNNRAKKRGSTSRDFLANSQVLRKSSTPLKMSRRPEGHGGTHCDGFCGGYVKMHC